MTTEIDRDPVLSKFTELCAKVSQRPFKGAPLAIQVGSSFDPKARLVVPTKHATCVQLALAYQDAICDATFALDTGRVPEVLDELSPTDFAELRLTDARAYQVVAVRRFGKEAFDAALAVAEAAMLAEVAPRATTERRPQRSSRENPTSRRCSPSSTPEPRRSTPGRSPRRRARSPSAACLPPTATAGSSPPRKRPARTACSRTSAREATPSWPSSSSTWRGRTARATRTKPETSRRAPRSASPTCGPPTWSRSTATAPRRSTRRSAKNGSGAGAVGVVSHDAYRVDPEAVLGALVERLRATREEEKRASRL